MRESASAFFHFQPLQKGLKILLKSLIREEPEAKPSFPQVKLDPYDVDATSVVHKLCVATPWCIVLIFNGRRKIIWITRWD